MKRFCVTVSHNLYLGCRNSSPNELMFIFRAEELPTINVWSTRIGRVVTLICLCFSRARFVLRTILIPRCVDRRREHSLKGGDSGPEILKRMAHIGGMKGNHVFKAGTRPTHPGTGDAFFSALGRGLNGATANG